MARLMLEDVLIVDDSRAHTQFMEDLCQQLGVHEVRSALHGEAALQQLRDKRPSMMLLDLEMPQLDGVQVLQHMAQEGLIVPVILVSAKDMMLLSTVELMGRELGLPVLGALKKPLNVSDVRDLVSRMYMTDSEEKALPLCSDTDVRRALQSKSIIPYFQPKVTLQGQVLKGAELLARWPQDGKVISPASFIPVIESCGWSTDLTLQMLDHALNQWQNWARKGLRMPMSINLSALSLSSAALVPQIEHQVNSSKVPPRFIIFEITETAVAENLAEAMGVAARLRLAGFGLSIDDFGTGFATMQQLVRFPFTELKIDQSLVRSISSKPHLQNVVYSVVELAERMSLTTVAEGIESVPDSTCLEERGCMLGQGYLYAKPMPPIQFEGWVKQRHTFDAQLH